MQESSQLGVYLALAVGGAMMLCAAIAASRERKKQSRKSIPEVPGSL